MKTNDGNNVARLWKNCLFICGMRSGILNTFTKIFVFGFVATNTGYIVIATYQVLQVVHKDR